VQAGENDRSPRKKLGGHGPLRTLPAVPETRFRRGWLDLRFDCNMATISGRLGEGSELGIEAKVCELSNQALGPHVFGAAIEMVRTEVLKLRAVLEHVVNGREQRGRNRTGRLLWTSAPAKAEELCIEVAAFPACSRLGTLDQQGLEPGGAFSQTGGTALAGTLIVAWTQPGPGQEVSPILRWSFARVESVSSRLFTRSIRIVDGH
jgi:hypothetical protein